MITTFKRVDNGIEFHLEASGVNDAKYYVALGLSKTQMMGDDAVVGCFGDTAANYWNTASPFYSWPIQVYRNYEKGFSCFSALLKIKIARSEWDSMF